MYDQLYDTPDREYEQHRQHDSDDDEITSPPMFEVTFSDLILLHAHKGRDDAAKNLYQREFSRFFFFFSHTGTTIQKLSGLHPVSLPERSRYV